LLGGGGIRPPTVSKLGLGRGPGKGRGNPGGDVGSVLGGGEGRMGMMGRAWGRAGPRIVPVPRYGGRRFRVNSLVGLFSGIAAGWLRKPKTSPANPNGAGPGKRKTDGRTDVDF